MSLSNPWPEWDINTKVYSTTTETSWLKLWPVPHNTTNPVQVAADFYLLQAISAGFMVDKKPPFTDFSEERIREAAAALGIKNEIIIEERIAAGRKKEEETINPLYSIETEAHQYLNGLVDEHIDTFVNYLEMTCGGELRHHKAFGSNILPSERRHAWGAWKVVRETYGLQALEVAIDYFNDFSGGSFGGARWATNPQLLLNYYTNTLGNDQESNRRMFMDRVFTLVHNNGCMLNKLEWKGGNAGGTLEHRMIEVLEAHAADEPDLDTLAKWASKNVLAIHQKYVTEIEKQNA